jgi:hypothetical protein
VIEEAIEMFKICLENYETEAETFKTKGNA